MSEVQSANQVPGSSLPTEPGAPALKKVPSKPKKKPWLWIILSPLLLGMLGLLVGLVGGFLYNSFTPPVFESDATVMIESITLGGARPNIPNAGDQASMFLTEKTVTQCFEKNHLYHLKSFDDLPEEDVVARVLDNLEMENFKKGSSVFQFSYRNPNPSDAQTVLNCLIDQHQNNLANEHEKERDASERTVRAAKEKAEEQLKLAQKKILEFDKQFGTIKDPALMKSKIWNREKNLKAELENLLAQKKRITTALRSGTQAIEGMNWELVQSGELERESHKKNLEKLVKEGAGKLDSKDAKKLLENLKAEDDSKKTKLEEFAKVIDSKIEKAQRSIELFDRENKKLQSAIGQNDDKQKQRDLLANELQTAEMMFSMTIDKLNEIQVMGRIPKTKFQILQTSTYGKPIWPILPVSLGLGALVGLIIGAMSGIFVAILIVICS